MKTLLVKDSEDQIVVRDNLYLAFFGNRPFEELVDGASVVFEKWMQLVPEESLNWVVLSTTQEDYRPVVAKDFDKCRKLLTKPSAAKKDVRIDLVGPQPYGADFRLQILGRKQPRKAGFLNQTSVIEMRFPSKFLVEFGVEEFVQLSAECFNTLQCDSGLATFGYSSGSEADYTEASKHVVQLAFRHKGMDLAQNLGVSQWLGRKCRGARWLTMISDDLRKELGDSQKVRELASLGIGVIETSAGVLLRAGVEPEIGETNKGVGVPMLSAVADAIESITYFKDNSLLPMLNHDPNLRDKWERRFWDAP